MDPSRRSVHLLESRARSILEHLEAVTPTQVPAIVEAARVKRDAQERDGHICLRHLFARQFIASKVEHDVDAASGVEALDRRHQQLAGAATPTPLLENAVAAIRRLAW